jgi:hypothetical protein
MKRSVLLLFGFLLTVSTFGQSNAIDEMFDKYSDREGYTYVSISGKMLGMLASLQSEEEKEQSPLPKIRSIRILTTDSLNTYNVNFYSELSKRVDFSSYEELMVIKKQKEVTKFLVKQTGNTVTELLLISGGQGSNTLISIRGDIDLKKISEISKTVGIDELNQLNNTDKKPQK